MFADEPTGALNQGASKEVMNQLIKLNEEGTTIMLVTHDKKVAAKCSRILYIVDGNIKGELKLGKLADMNEVAGDETYKERERKVNRWLEDMGW